MRMNMNLRPSHLRVDRAIRWLSRFFQPRLAFHGPEARINGDFYKKSRMWKLYKREFAELEGTCVCVWRTIFLFVFFPPETWGKPAG